MTSARDQLRNAMLGSTAWIHNLAEGDKAAYLTGDHWTTNVMIVPVLRLTTTQIILENGGRYYRADGRSVGGARIYRHQLIPPDCPKVFRVMIDMVGREMVRELESKLQAHNRTKPDERPSWRTFAGELAEITKTKEKRLGDLELGLKISGEKYAGKEVDRSWR